MSTGQKAKYLKELEKERSGQVICLNILGEQVKCIEPNSQEFHDFKFLMDNQEKIIRNKKLIELLG